MATATTEDDFKLLISHAHDQANEKLELKPNEWKSVVGDETQRMTLSHGDEIKFLSSQNANLAEYLKLHPEMAHELMAPTSSKEFLVRRYERHLSGEKMLSAQNGAVEKAHWDEESFNALLPGMPKVISNPNNNDAPNWRELNAFISTNRRTNATFFEYKQILERVIVIDYRDMKVEVTAKQWHLMSDRVMDLFANPITPRDVEFHTLHNALKEISTIPMPLHDWFYPLGQQIAILLKQLEHRLRGIHNGDSRPCVVCCPFRPASAGESLAPTFQVFLSKAEAASIVCEERLARNQHITAMNYDPYVHAVLKAKHLVAA